MMQPNELSAIERLLLDWADWMGRGGSSADGYPRKSFGAPDARIHSFEDLEIEVDNHVMICIDTAVNDLIPPERNCILRRYGLQKAVWRLANEQLVFDLAIDNLKKLLKSKIVV